MNTTLPVRRSFDMFLTPNIFIVFGAIVLNVLFYIIYLVIPDKTSFIIYHVFFNLLVVLLFILPKYMWNSSN